MIEDDADVSLRDAQMFLIASAFTNKQSVNMCLFCMSLTKNSTVLHCISITMVPPKYILRVESVCIVITFVRHVVVLQYFFTNKCKCFTNEHKF